MGILREEVFAKISALEAQGACQIVDFEHKLDLSRSAVEEALTRLFTNTLEKAEKGFSDRCNRQREELSTRIGDLEEDQRTLHDF